ncbi:unannotated protein [freshwater metagenome]|uniref:Unannotated protein n=1 Tax=freshwater metagenome TaxID=449393 RepID=A0A6J6SD73_9ZZZZ|nr:phospho-sugar mutase [Actinomycetota bacterium]
MISDALRTEVLEWIANDPDPESVATLRKWLADSNEVELLKSFSGFLEFGTAGLRGPVRPGPSGMNRAVVSRTAAGIAAFMKSHGLNKIVIGRDARHGSAEFMQESAEVLAGFGLDVYLLPRQLPTPLLAFAVNELAMDCGVMITASHNPAIDNGYKVYLGGSVAGINYNGSQIISPTDTQISEEIARVQMPIPRGSKWKFVDETLIDKYLQVTSQGMIQKASQKIVYTAMHGVGTETLLSLFKSAGFDKPILVAEQAEPDPNFPTVAFPNPEESGAMDLAIALAKAQNADLVIANDPDADRCAVAVKDSAGNWRTLRGDELGVILGDAVAKKISTTNVSFATTIVSSSALSKIAANAGAKYTETLTGFKWISKVADLAYGYEEAIGYCINPRAVNDKDGISAALFIAELNSDLISKGSSLIEYLEKIWSEIGYHHTEQLSIRVTDLKIIGKILRDLAAKPLQTIAGQVVTSFENLSDADIPTPGFRIRCGVNLRVIIRPSGTEPKLKAYFEAIDEQAAAINLIREAKSQLSQLFASYS